MIRSKFFFGPETILGKLHKNYSLPQDYRREVKQKRTS